MNYMRKVQILALESQTWPKNDLNLAKSQNHTNKPSEKQDHFPTQFLTMSTKKHPNIGYRQWGSIKCFEFGPNGQTILRDETRP